jgi:hypothetical protein
MDDAMDGMGNRETAPSEQALHQTEAADKRISAMMACNSPNNNGVSVKPTGEVAAYRNEHQANAMQAAGQYEEGPSQAVVTDYTTAQVSGADSD